MLLAGPRTVTFRPTILLNPPATASKAVPICSTSDRRLDLTRASRELGYQPQIGVREAVRRTADWYRQQGLLARR